MSRPLETASRTIGKTPFTRMVLPFKLSSPINIILEMSSEMTPRLWRIEIAIARSKYVPLFLRLPGEKLIVIRLGGTRKPEFLRAVRTRSLDSLISDDIRPTMSNDGRPLQMSVSTVTGSTTTPVIVAQLALHTIISPSLLNF